MLVHTVFFWLKPELPAAEREAFHQALKGLATLRTARAGYVGRPAATEKRPVVDDSYDAALTVIFEDLAGHDAYQQDPLHLAFIAENRGRWSRVQVYDAE